MNRRKLFLTGIRLFIFIMVASYGFSENHAAYAIKAGRILTITNGDIYNGIVLIKDGKIRQVNQNLSIPEGYILIDASPYWLLPGFIDVHSHSGCRNAEDINDTAFQLNPGLRILDAMEINTQELMRAVAGGVTTINFIPGSGSNIGGLGVIMKTAGKDIDEAIVSFPSVLKIAQAGNPERRIYGQIGAGRMGMNWHLREFMKEIRAYDNDCKGYESGNLKAKPKMNIDYECVRPILSDKLIAFVHCPWFQPTQSAFRMYYDEFGIKKVIITHGEWGAWRNSPEIAKRGIHYDCGPRLYDFENDSFIGIATEFLKGGVKSISINTDSSVDGQEKLFLQASMAVRLGLDEKVALEAITINAAKALGLDHRIGSIESGKDADLVLWTGNPLDIRNYAILVFINGRIVYDISKHGQRF